MRTTLFRTDVAHSKRARVVREKNMISSFAVVTKGVTKDSRGEFDEAALDMIVELGNQSKIGVKSRFGHPNMSNTALGTFLGRVKNFTRDGDIVRADLCIDETAFSTPDGDLASYVMNLAESDPEAFGASMVIYWDEEKREEKDEQGNEKPPFIRVQKLFSVDVVDDPAANDGFFGTAFFSDGVKPSAEMTAFLDTFLSHPDAVDKVAMFLDRYKSNQNEKQIIKNVKGGRFMFEELTLEKLKAERADLFDVVRGEGYAGGIKKGAEEGARIERARAVEILKNAALFKDTAGLAFSAVEQGLSAEQAIINFQKKQLEGLQNASAPEVGPDGDPEAKKPATHFERAKAYQKEHNCSMTVALQATAEKRK
ncbi:MAG: hypothetical protein ABIH47_09185 [Candidatus Omnitrophota bacterium]